LESSSWPSEPDSTSDSIDARDWNAEFEVPATVLLEVDGFTTTALSYFEMPGSIMAEIMEDLRLPPVAQLLRVAVEPSKVDQYDVLSLGQLSRVADQWLFRSREDNHRRLAERLAALDKSAGPR
jgi:hypothetical protein